MGLNSHLVFCEGWHPGCQDKQSRGALWGLGSQLGWWQTATWGGEGSGVGEEAEPWDFDFHRERKLPTWPWQGEQGEAWNLCSVWPEQDQATHREAREAQGRGREPGSLLIGRPEPRGRRPHSSGSARGAFWKTRLAACPAEAWGRRWQLSDGDRGRQPTSPGPGPSARPASGRSPACEPGRRGREGQPRGYAGREAAGLVLSCPVLISLDFIPQSWGRVWFSFHTHSMAPPFPFVYGLGRGVLKTSLSVKTEYSSEVNERGVWQ